MQVNATAPSAWLGKRNSGIARRAEAGVTIRSWRIRTAAILKTVLHAHASSDVRFSNRPFGVKHFQTIRRCGVDVAHGLVLLFGIGTRALPSWDSKTRWSNLRGGLTVFTSAALVGAAMCSAC